MTIVYPLAFPTVTGPARARIFIQAAVGMTESPFTYQTQVQKNPGQRFGMEITLGELKLDEAAVWAPFLVSLNGRWGTFLAGDSGRATPRGAAAATPGTPLVKGASQTGDQLVIDGAPASTTGYLKAFDYIQLGTGAATHLHMVLQDADTDAGTEVTLTLWPSLRVSPADNDPVVVSSAKGLFRLTTNKTDWIERATLFGVRFPAVEAL